MFRVMSGFNNELIPLGYYFSKEGHAKDAREGMGLASSKL